jgi:CubicO group peptidase (beta-lactamase class C family)
MRTNQLPEGIHVNFPNLSLPDTVFGLASAIVEHPEPDEPPGRTGEYWWGGMAGTAAFIAPESNVAGICFTQRMPAAFHPYTYEFNRFVHQSADSKKPDTRT